MLLRLYSRCERLKKLSIQKTLGFLSRHTCKPLTDNLTYVIHISTNNFWTSSAVMAKIS